MVSRNPAKKKQAAEPKSRGLNPSQSAHEKAPQKVLDLEEAILDDGGAVLGVFRDPLGGFWQILAVLPLELVQPTPYQRDLSPAHVEKLGHVIDQLNRFLDPVIAVRTPEGVYQTPNGHHRTAAMRGLGAKSITALIIPEVEMAYQILALNTEKAHNLREKSLEVIRMARELALLDPRPEKDFAVQFEEPYFVTLGICYEKNGRFAGGAYQSVLKRTDAFLSAPLPKALVTREERATKLLQLDLAVQEIIKDLKDRGFVSPYLRAFVVARINPLRFQRSPKADFDETLEKMLTACKRFNFDNIKAEQIASAAGPAE